MAYLNLKPVEFSALSAKVKATIVWTGRLMLPKWDGCMMLVGFFDGVPDFILSRDNKPVKSMAHIYEDILAKWPAIVNTVGGVCFIGEAWLPGKAFKDISGMFRRHTTQTGLGFAVFDQVRYDRCPEGPPLLYANTPYHQRLRRLLAWQEGPRLCPNVWITEPVVCEDEAHALRYAKNLKNLGSYDGCIVSDGAACYTPGSGSGGEFLKVKPLQSFTLEVVGIVVSKGEKTGRDTLSLQVRFKTGVCGVGTGFDHEQAAFWMAGIDPIVGTLIEVACMGVYDGPDGMMREPRYIGPRTDAIADY